MTDAAHPHPREALARPMSPDQAASDIRFGHEPPEEFIPMTPLPPPANTVGVIGWMRYNLFGSPANTIITLVCLYLLYEIIPPLVSFFVVNAVWGAVDHTVCREAAGACWAFVAEKYRLVLFGTYPFEEQWRPTLVIALFVSIIAASCYKPFWRRELFFAWAGAVVLMLILQGGGVFGLSPVPTLQWGGLVLTLMLAVFGSVLAFPIGICLALGRRSDLPVVRTLCVTYIEVIRGVPLISVLFMASIMLPLFLPEELNIDLVLRALVAITLFIAAYLAETVRGGLQALSKGQYEAADALGLGYWQKMGLIILPQALKISIPTLVSGFIALFKDTSLVLIIGLGDLMFMTRTAIADVEWGPFFIEAYVFTGLIYFSFCFCMSAYGKWLERTLDTTHR